MVACRPVCVFSCDRWRPRHGRHDGGEVFGGNDGLREEPDTDERPAGTAAGPGHRPASPRSPRHQRAAVLFIDRSAHKHTHLHTNAHTETMEWCHTHTRSRLTQRDLHTKRLTQTWCFAATKKITKTRWHNRIWCFSVCSKTKKETEKNDINKVFSSSVLYSQWRTINTGELNTVYILPAVVLAMRRVRVKHIRPSTMGQILWSWRCFYSTEFLFIYIWIYIYYICGGKHAN